MAQMFRATISKRRIGEVVECVRSGEPVAPEGATWSLVDSLTVAGVLLSSAMAASSYTSPGTKQGAQRILQDLQVAIEFVGAMATAHGNGTWDEYFEPSVTIAIEAGGFTPLAGFKRGSTDGGR